MLELSELDRGDGNRQSGITVYPHSRGRSFIWDATGKNTYAFTNQLGATLVAGSVAKAAETKKNAKYAVFGPLHIF